MKNIKSIFLIVAVFVTAFIFIFLFVVKNNYLSKKTKVTPNNETEEIAKQAEVINASNEADNKVAINQERRDYGKDAYVIERGWINWQEPQDVGNLGLTNEKVYKGCKQNECDLGGDNYANSDGIKYVKVGNFVEGKYKGGELFDVVSKVGDGPMGKEFFRLIKFNDEFIVPIRMIQSYDYKLEDSTVYFESILKSIFKNKKVVIDKDIVIDELIFPSALRGNLDRQVLIKVEGENLFFTNEKLKLAFTHPVYGDVWTTDATKAKNKTSFELNSFFSAYNQERYFEDSFDRYGFYIKLPDGSTAIYKMKFDIFDKEDRYGKLLATWISGEENNIEYEIFPSGCGVGEYIYNRDLEIDKFRDLKIIGKTQQGDNLFGFKGTDTGEFKKLYETIYWVKDGNKKSPEEFLKMNPEVFWMDPFGRLVAFFRADIISPAECGKPVIYLYPKEPMEVSVQVEPGNGLSITEPDYGNDGWKVFSDSQSNIRNLSDGKTYPYLFWEGMGDISYTQSQQGFVVAKNNLNFFFDDKLSQLGLIKKEIKDFKEFWIPEMNKLNKPYYFVTFLSKDFIDKLAPLSINPKPDTVIRIMMDYEGLDNYKATQGFKIKTPQRKGFTVVEWGGMLK